MVKKALLIIVLLLAGCEYDSQVEQKPAPDLARQYRDKKKIEFLEADIVELERKLKKAQDRKLPMAQSFKVIDTRRIPSADPARLGKLDWLVTYQLDAYRTYMVTIPKDELSEDDIKEAVRKDIEAVGRWTGKDFTL